MRLTIRGCFLVLTVIQAGCGEPDETAMSPCVAGTPTVAYDHFDRGIPLRELWRIGTAPGQDLAFVTDAAASADGSVYVADPMLGVVHRIRDGRILRTFGRRGEGPGEFLAPVEVSVRADTIFVFDTSLWRLSLFNESGEFLESRNLQRLPYFGQVPDLELAGGAVYSLAFPADFSEQLINARGGGERLRVPTAIKRWLSDDSGWVPVLTELPSIEVLVSAAVQDAPFANRPLWGVAEANELLWYTDTKELRLRRRRIAEGVECSMVGEGFPDTGITADERDAFYHAEDIDPENPTRATATRNARRGMPLPDEKPLLRSLVVSRHGSLFLELTTEAPATYLMLSPEGVPVGYLALPEEGRILAHRDTLLLALVRDALDIQSLVAYRIDTVTAGFR